MIGSGSAAEPDFSLALAKITRMSKEELNELLCVVSGTIYQMGTNRELMMNDEYTDSGQSKCQDDE